MSLQGGKLAGGNPENGRVENDFYATNPKAVETLFQHYSFTASKILEPCVGQGHIANFINSFFTNKREVVGVDLVDRGYPDTIVANFLEWDTDEKFDGIISNPPYSLAKEFVEKGMDLLEDEGQMAMFLKVQFLEGLKRKELFEKHPPKYIYVFRSRMATWNNGQETDDKGKRWATTMCHAWFVWEKGSRTEPIVRWL
ncbi:MAG: hypothetical protein ACRDD7_15585 [Peptostreptococcaceae bacterium]